LPQRFRAAALAICFRLAAERFAALAFPPLDAPSLLNAKAAGFLPAFGSSSGDPSICSPIACSTTRRAFAKKSRAFSLGTIQSCHESRVDAMPVEIKLTHYRNFISLVDSYDYERLLWFSLLTCKKCTAKRDSSRTTLEKRPESGIPGMGSDSGFMNGQQTCHHERSEGPAGSHLIKAGRPKARYLRGQRDCALTSAVPTGLGSIAHSTQR